MNITSDFRALTPGATRKPGTRDAFIKEAYKLYHSMLQIQSYLQKTRKAYLGVEHLTDKQREEIDYEVKASVREAAARVKELESVEEERRQVIDSKPYWTKLLRDPADDAQSKVLATHRSGITWYLNHTLLSISQKHADTKTIRLNKEEDKRLNSHTTHFKPRYAEVENEQTFTEEQLQLYQSENNQMIQDFENQLDKVRTVQSKLMEIAELSSELQQHLQHQTEMTDRLMEEAVDTTRDVTKGNEQLTQAKRRNATYRIYIVTILMTLSFTLLFLDYYAA